MEYPTAQGVRSLVADSGTGLELLSQTPRRALVTASSATGRPGLTAEVDLADAVGYWSPTAQHVPLPPDWEAPVITSLVSSAPLGVLYNAAGESLLGWAASEAVAELVVRCGVSEERKTFVLEVRPQTALATDLIVLLDTGRDRLSEMIGRLAAWVSEGCPGRPREVPAAARRPVYSTWYTFAQDIDAQLVELEAGLAAALGCGSVFIDDGWQQFGHGRGYQGCGDWLPDATKFPDLAATVHRIRNQGSAVALWIAPLLLGADSAAYGALAELAPSWVADLNCFVLDPRHAAVRDHVAATCLRLVADYGVELLKIDFLDQAMVYRGSSSGGDLSDVGEAMQQLLRQVRVRLADGGFERVAFEFRQPYVGPAIARHGEILRDGDCPADSVTNRRSVVDCRLLSVGQIVHSDPMMWGVEGGPEAVAQQLYAGWFSVPQISMRLADLPTVQSEALEGLLRLWHDHADVSLDGRLDTQGAEHGHLVVRAVRPDLGRGVIVTYAPLVIDLEIGEGVSAEILVVNACSADRLVIRSAGGIVSGVIRSASGAIIAEVTPLEPGLIELAVPAYGSVSLQSEGPHPSGA